jgi:hypothetical protein
MEPQESDKAFFDGRGCLTREGLAALAAAPAGAGPRSVALHVASCARCQQQLLALSEGENPVPATPRREAGGSRRWLYLGLLLGVMLLALTALMVTLAHLGSQ